MSNTNEPEVKDVERVEIDPAGDDGADETETETPTPDSSQEEAKDPEETTETDEPEGAEPEKAKPATENAASTTTETDEYGDIKRVAGETNREFALRIENARLRGDLRRGRAQEILTPPPPAAKKELSPERKKVLEQYKPEDIQKLKEVFGAMADDMGFVKKDELGASTFNEKASETLDSFLEAHPEYQPQNDPGNVLWNRFREEYGIYRPAQSPKELRKILEKVHRDVMGIKPAAALKTNDAAKEKVKVASHSSSSKPAPSREGVKRAPAATQGLRTDMLKGFSDEEIQELTGAE